jgi:hypothetical protein
MKYKPLFALVAVAGVLGMTVPAYAQQAQPILSYSTYLGGSSTEVGHGVAVDAAGNIYTAGYTSSANFPVLNAYQPTLAGTANGFVSKFSPTGTLLWSTFLGGRSMDKINDIATDAAGDVYVIGTTNSTNFPTSTTAYQNKLKGAGTNAFVSMFNTSGTLVYSTYLNGTTGYAEGVSIALDASGNVFVAGDTTATTFPVTAGAAQATNGGGMDGFIAELNPTLSQLLYGSYMGGSGSDSIRSIALDQNDGMYVTGYTNSTNLPTTAGAFQTSCGASCTSTSSLYDAFVAKASTSSLAYETYLTGSNTFTLGIGIAVDASGSAYVTGTTNSTDFPLLNPYQSVYGGTTDLPGGLAGCIDFLSARLPCGDAFVTKFNASGTGLVYSTYLGGSTADMGYSIAVDPAGDAYVGGYTQSVTSRTTVGFPTTAGAFQTWKGGGLEGFITEVAPSGSTLNYSTYYGGSNDEELFGITIDGAGNAYVSGRSISTDTPVTTGAFQSTFAGGVDAIVAKIGSGPGLVVNPTTAAFVKVQPVNTTSTPINVSLTNPGSTGQAVSVTIIGPFTETDNCASFVAASSSCNIAIVFAPVVAGSNTGRVNVLDTAGEILQSVQLSGSSH